MLNRSLPPALRLYLQTQKKLIRNLLADVRVVHIPLFSHTYILLFYQFCRRVR